MSSVKKKNFDDGDDNTYITQEHVATKSALQKKYAKFSKKLQEATTLVLKLGMFLVPIMFEICTKQLPLIIYTR